MIGKENILFFLKIGLKFQTTKEKRVKPWYLVARKPKPHYHVY